MYSPIDYISVDRLRSKHILCVVSLARSEGPGVALLGAVRDQAYHGPASDVKS